MVGERVVNAVCVGERGIVTRRCDGLATMRPTPAPESSELVFAVVLQVHPRCKRHVISESVTNTPHAWSISFSQVLGRVMTLASFNHNTKLLYALQQQGVHDILLIVGPCLFPDCLHLRIIILSITALLHPAQESAPNALLHLDLVNSGTELVRHVLRSDVGAALLAII